MTTMLDGPRYTSHGRTYAAYVVDGEVYPLSKWLDLATPAAKITVVHSNGYTIEAAGVRIQATIGGVLVATVDGKGPQHIQCLTSDDFAARFTPAPDAFQHSIIALLERIATAVERPSAEAQIYSNFIVNPLTKAPNPLDLASLRAEEIVERMASDAAVSDWLASKATIDATSADTPPKPTPGTVFEFAGHTYQAGFDGLMYRIGHAEAIDWRLLTEGPIDGFRIIGVATWGIGQTWED